MYSIVLFMVETSFSGFKGSGESPRSAVESTSATTRRNPPGERDDVRDAELLRQLDELVGAVSLPHEDELDVLTVRACELRGGVECEVDTILRTHHSEVGAQVLAAAPPVGIGRAAPKEVGVGSCPNDGDVRARNVPASHRGRSIGVVRRDHVVGNGVRGPLEEAEAARGRRSRSGT